MTEPDLSSFPTRRHGHGFEQFRPGEVFEHHWGKTVTAGDASLFAAVTHAYNPIYLNAEAARADGHPDVVVSPMLVVCIVVGLSVEDLSEAGGPFLGLDALTFHRPVYPGDTLFHPAFGVSGAYLGLHGFREWRPVDPGKVAFARIGFFTNPS